MAPKFEIIDKFKIWTAKLAPKFKKILDGREIIHTRDLHNSKFNATFGRGLIQLLRTMRFVFGMHGQPCMISEIRTPG